MIPIQEYHSVFPGSGEYDPYFLALKHMLINMAYIGAMMTERARRHAIIGIKIWHEESPATTAGAFQTYGELKALKKWEDGNYLSGFAVANKKLMALQGADLLAREAFKHADNLGIRPTRRPVKALKNRINFHLWNRECLEYLRSSGGPSNLEALTMWGHKKVGDAPRMTLLNSDGDFDY